MTAHAARPAAIVTNTFPDSDDAVRPTIVITTAHRSALTAVTGR
jgi:hypothetical protein